MSASSRSPAAVRHDFTAAFCLSLQSPPRRMRRSLLAGRQGGPQRRRGLPQAGTSTRERSVVFEPCLPPSSDIASCLSWGVALRVGMAWASVFQTSSPAQGLSCSVRRQSCRCCAPWTMAQRVLQTLTAAAMAAQKCRHCLESGLAALGKLASQLRQTH